MTWLVDHHAATRSVWSLVIVCCVAVFLLASPADASRDLPDMLAPTIACPVADVADLDRNLPVRPTLPFFSAADIVALSYGYDGPDQLLSLTTKRGSVGHHLFQGLWTDPVTGISYARNRWYDARTASWLSEDPMGAVDSPNLYAFVGWGPHMATDPMGLYGKDVHFYATYYIARATGVTHEDAISVAWAAQFVDEFPSSAPVRIDEAVFHHERFTRTLRAFHMVSTNQGLDPVKPMNFIVRKNLDRATATRNKFALGIALHTVADSYSHSGFVAVYNSKVNRRTGSGRPDIGHADAPEGGHSVDKPYNDVRKAMILARTLYDKLSDAGFLDREGSARSFESIEGRLSDLFSASPGRVESLLDNHAVAAGEEAMRNDMWQLAISLDFGVSVDYESFVPPSQWESEFGKQAEDQRSFVLKLEGVDPWDFGFNGSVTVTADSPGTICGVWGCIPED